MPAADIVFILVEPARAENVGAAARAIKTMGFDQLWLVNPCDLEKEARWVAHESQDILDNARCFSSLEQALALVDFSVATTARRRLQRDDYLTPAACCQAIFGKGGGISRAALVFGRESSGLTGAEMQLCDAATRLPIANPQPSLNLGQAVMLYAWEMSKASDAAPATELPGKAQSNSSDQAGYAVVKQALNKRLENIGVAPEDNLHRWTMEGVSRFDQRDLGMLMQILKRL